MDTQKTRTITLTDRPPVRIVEDEWPVIAHGRYYDHDGEIPQQATREWTCDIRVRQHADGRAIAYGSYDYDTRWQGAHGLEVRAGELLEPGADLVVAIRSVGATLREAIEEAHVAQTDVAHVSEAIRDCIADLPAETI